MSKGELHDSITAIDYGIRCGQEWPPKYGGHLVNAPLLQAPYQEPRSLPNNKTYPPSPKHPPLFPLGFSLINQLRIW